MFDQVDDDSIRTCTCIKVNSLNELKFRSFRMCHASLFSLSLSFRIENWLCMSACLAHRPVWPADECVVWYMLIWSDLPVSLHLSLLISLSHTLNAFNHMFALLVIAFRCWMIWKARCASEWVYRWNNDNMNDWKRQDKAGHVSSLFFFYSFQPIQFKRNSWAMLVLHAHVRATLSWRWWGKGVRVRANERANERTNDERENK